MKYLLNLLLVIVLITSSFILFTPNVEASSCTLNKNKTNIIKKINENIDKKTDKKRLLKQ